MTRSDPLFIHLAAVDVAIILVYFAAIVFLGFWLRRRAVSGIDAYFLGSRKVPWWALGMSGTASNFDMTGTMVVISFVYALGLQGVWVSMRGGMVLPLGLLLVFMGRWLRRSRVMTNAEWMTLRFGEGRDGRLARLLSAVSNLIVTVAFLTYFVKGTGKFLSVFIALPETHCALIMVAVGLTYTVLSGFHGVVWTDVLQELLLVFVSLTVGYLAVTLPEHAGVIASAGSGWSRLLPRWEASPMAWLPDPDAYRMFGLCLIFWMAKGVLEGAGGFTGGYMTQRYFAAASDRDAVKMTAAWVVLLSFRWVLVMGIAVIGLSLAADSEAFRELLAADPEKTLPEVVKRAIPAGLRGALIAGLIAAAMSTFDSTVNAGAAYWVRDIYQRHIRPNASEKRLVRQSYLASLVLALIGVVAGLSAHNIDDVWGWITGPLAAGLFAPIILRWYWWRLNGYGFAAATAAGLLTAVAIRALGLGWPLYVTFPLTWGIAFASGLGGSLVTPRPPMETLIRFWQQVRPFGVWGAVQGEVAPEIRDDVRREHRQIYRATPIAVAWHLSGVACAVAWVLQRLSLAAAAGALFIGLGVVLYFKWYAKISR